MLMMPAVCARVLMMLGLMLAVPVRRLTRKLMMPAVSHAGIDAGCLSCRAQDSADADDAGIMLSCQASC